MKKHLLTATMIVSLSLAAACGTTNVSGEAPVSTVGEENSLVSEETVTKEAMSTETATEVAETTQTTTPAVEDVAANTEAVNEDAASVTGVVDEVKDFMFIIQDEAGTYYSFPYGEESELDLSNIEVGDKVTVNFVGTLSETDPFAGNILSVQKVEE